jgi:hypothetical protein
MEHNIILYKELLSIEERDGGFITVSPIPAKTPLEFGMCAFQEWLNNPIQAGRCRRQR